MQRVFDRYARSDATALTLRCIAAERSRIMCIFYFALRSHTKAEY